jgi:hypothetical protein
MSSCELLLCWNGFGLFERFERKEMRAEMETVLVIGLLFLKDPRFAFTTIPNTKQPVHANSSESRIKGQ